MKIVITGGPGTGKTSIINKLESLGHHVFHESSREIIRKYKKLGHDQLFLSNPIKFSEILLKFPRAVFDLLNRPSQHPSGFQS